MQNQSTSELRRSSTVKQRWLPIEAAPLKVRAHGLRDAHSRPLVSPGKIGGVFAASFRVSPWAAWHFSSLEIRSGNSYTSLILDLDGRGSYERAAEAVELAKVGPLNWSAENLRTGGVHLVWTLENPVHRGATALAAPLKRYARISEYYAAVLGADEGYTGVLTHNPMEAAQLPGFKTHWLRREPYTLSELAEFIPFRWRKPKVSKTAAGRNCDVFAHCMKWAGSPVNLGSPVLAEALAVNEGFEFPLDPPEVGGIVRSVERYRRKWIKQGKFWRPGHSSYDHSPDAQAHRGKRSGESRRRGTPLEDDRTPWVTEGTSRATWYRKRRWPQGPLDFETEPNTDS